MRERPGGVKWGSAGQHAQLGRERPGGGAWVGEGEARGSAVGLDRPAPARARGWTGGGSGQREGKPKKARNVTWQPSASNVMRPTEPAPIATH